MASVTCPNPPAGLIPGSSYHVFALFVTIFFPIFVVLCLLLFFCERNSSIYLRKRYVGPTLFSCGGAMISWSVTVLYDWIGAIHYPCALFGFLHYMAIPCIAAPLLFKLARYSTEVAIMKLSKEIRLQNEENLQERQRRATSGGGGSNPQVHGGMESIPIWLADGGGETKDLGLEGEISLKALLGHLRVQFSGSRTRKDRILNAKFIRSTGFLLFWFCLTALPYLLAYFIRLGTDEVWQSSCTGCDLAPADAGVLLAISSFTMVSGTLTNSIKVSKRDELRIVRECLLVWVVSGTICNLGLALFLVDPGGLYAQGQFNWRFVFFLGTVVSVYLQTAHQVLMGRFLKNKLLTSNHFNRADRFTVVMGDKTLKEELRNHLNRELSGEILMFLDAVDQFRAVHGSATPAAASAAGTNGGQVINSTYKDADSYRKQAKRIYDSFVVKGAPNEINIGSDLRHDVLVKMVQVIQQGTCDGSIFDGAYDEVRSNLLRDGFGRFLNKIKSKNEAGGSLFASMSSSRHSLVEMESTSTPAKSSAATLPMSKSSAHDIKKVVSATM